MIHRHHSTVMPGLDPLLSGLEKSVVTPLIASLTTRHHRA
jgi:hypothetical protein